MKKSLVALAVLAATASFAQSSVTIDGYIDRGYTTTNSTNDNADARAIASSAGTSTLGIKGVEDLGGGLKAGFTISTDFNATPGNIAQDTATATTTTQGAGFANSQVFIELQSATAGKVQLGTINNELLTAVSGVASPAFATGVGSTYSGSFTGFNGVGTGVATAVGIVQPSAIGNTGTGTRGIRQAHTVKYVSPNMNGVTVAYGMVPKNNTGTGDTVGVTDFSIRYQQGALDVMYATLEYDTNTTDTAVSQVHASVPGAGAKYKHSILGATYDLGNGFKVHGGTGGTSSTDAGGVRTSLKQIGVTYTIGNVDLMAQIARVDDSNATDNDRKMQGLGLNYNFSKTTRAYIRYESLNYNYGGDAVAGSEIKRTAVGLSKSF